METFMMASAPGEVTLHRVFPMPPVEARWPDLVEVHAVETAHVDVDLFGVGARHVEGMDAAVATEVMLRHAGVEAVRRELAVAGQQLELLARNDEVQDPLLRTDRAVALADALEARGDAKAHPAAMAAAVVSRQGSP